MSPTYPTQHESDLRSLLKTFKERLDPDVVFHEPINPRGANFQMTIKAAREAGQSELADGLAALQDKDHWVKYATNQLTTVERLGEELNVPVHLWPDEELIKNAGEIKGHLRKEREKSESPENYPQRSASIL